MKKILITGSSGFVGTNLISYCIEHDLESEGLSLRTDFPISIPKEIDVIVHLSGKAHDLKNVSDPSEYFIINTELTKKIFDLFLLSKASVFIFVSSVKACKDVVDGILTEDCLPNPLTVYGISKLQAEQYLLSKKLEGSKRLYIIRPCMIHGPGNKGNLNLLYNFVVKGIPWPLGSFNNERSFLSIENFCFCIKEIVVNNKIPSGIYNIADDEAISTNSLIEIISRAINKKCTIYKIPEKLIILLARFGDLLKLPFNTENLNKSTSNYKVSNSKIVKAIGKNLPVTAMEGLFKTIQSFKKNGQ